MYTILEVWALSLPMAARVLEIWFLHVYAKSKLHISFPITADLSDQY